MPFEKYKVSRSNNKRKPEDMFVSFHTNRVGMYISTALFNAIGNLESVDLFFDPDTRMEAIAPGETLKVHTRLSSAVVSARGFSSKYNISPESQRRYEVKQDGELWVFGPLEVDDE